MTSSKLTALLALAGVIIALNSANAQQPYRVEEFVAQQRISNTQAQSLLALLGKKTIIIKYQRGRKLSLEFKFRNRAKEKIAHTCKSSSL